MLFALGTSPQYQRNLTREAATALARNWWVVLLNGLALIAAGVLILSIDWSVESLATFFGALFIFEGLTLALTFGMDTRARVLNVVTGLLSIVTGVVIIAWPEPGLVAVAIVLGSWLIVIGTTTIVGAFAARDTLPDWWLLLVMGLAEVALGVLAVADPGDTLVALITVGGIWAVAIGVIRVALSAQLKRLPDDVDEALGAASANGASRPVTPDAGRFTPTATGGSYR